MGSRDHARYALTKSVADYNHRSSARSRDSCSSVVREIAHGKLFHCPRTATNPAGLQSSYAITRRNNGAREIVKILCTSPQRRNHQNEWSIAVNQHFDCCVSALSHTRLRTNRIGS
jgi:hypothetical protein